MDPRVLRLYDEYTHAPLERRVFLERLALLAGGSAAAMALLPLIENNYARAALVEPGDERLALRTIAYPGASGEVRAYLALPKAGPAKRPGVIVIHENRGLNPHIQDVVRRVALEGYTALAPDLLSPLGGTPANEDEARAMIGRLDRQVAARNLVTALAWLEARPDAVGPVGVVGFCWGGGMANQLAVHAPRLAAAVPFYGPAPDPADAAKIRAKLLLHYAENDAFVNPGVAGYEAALRAAGVAYEKHVYAGTQHAFHNDTAGARYDQAAAHLAWARTIEFLKTHLGR